MESYKLVINPEYEHLRHDLEAIARGERPPGADEFFRVRNSLYRATIGGVDIVVKDFRKPNFINSFIYTTLRRSKARRSYENAMKLSRMGFNTPAPIAYAEHKVNGRLVNSYYISAELKDATEMRDWTKLPHLDTLLSSFAREIVKLHQSGIFNKDFTGGNILFTRDKDGSYIFNYVDLNRVVFNNFSRNALYKMLGCVATPDYSETRRIARLYAEAAGVDADEIVRGAVKALDEYLRVRRLKKRLRGK